MSCKSEYNIHRIKPTRRVVLETRDLITVYSPVQEMKDVLLWYD